MSGMMGDISQGTVDARKRGKLYRRRRRYLAAAAAAAAAADDDARVCSSWRMRVQMSDVAVGLKQVIRNASSVRRKYCLKLRIL
jgi:hypothetical protein